MASLTLATLILLVYVPVLIWATLMEKWYGTPAVHFAIYNTAWFTAINVLLAVNILLAMLVRLPWRRRQAGFLLTHGGVLVLLVGCLITREAGMEATLSVVEGRDSHVAYRSDAYHFEIAVLPGEQATGNSGQKNGQEPASSPISSPRPLAGEGPGVRAISSPRPLAGEGPGVRASNPQSLIPNPSPICIPLETGPLDWKKPAHAPAGKPPPSFEELPWFPWHIPYRSEGVVYDKDGIQLEVLDYVTEPVPSVEARLTVDDKFEDVHLTLPDPVSYELGFAERPTPKAVAGRGRRASLTLAQRRSTWALPSI